ncbi:putative TPR repeat-containing protein [Acidobacteriia bacterium SbA2]|nr:putative TPR repeat-containing protein [Acidobacteriia bacterium SbA2]
MRAVISILVLALLPSLLLAQEASADELLKRAINAQQHGDYSEAITQYHKVLQLRPSDVEAEVNLGAALAHEGRYDEAIEMYRSALSSLKNNNMVRLNLALAYYKKGDFEHAREQFTALHNARPDDVRTLILLGDTDLHLEKPDSAIALLEPPESKFSQNTDFEYVLGRALIMTGRRRDGVTRLEKAAQSGLSPDSYLLAGATLLDLDEYEPARKDLEEALRLNPALPGIYTQVGIARDKTGDAKNAESAFREALKANPDDFDANLYLGAILYKRRGFQEAKGYLDRALQLKPRDSMARYEAAMLKSTSGDYENAARELEELTKDDPDWLEPHVELAALYYRLHRPEDGAKERRIVDQITAKQQAQGPGK